MKLTIPLIILSATVGAAAVFVFLWWLIGVPVLESFIFGTLFGGNALVLMFGLAIAQSRKSDRR